MTHVVKRPDFDRVIGCKHKLVTINLLDMSGKQTLTYKELFVRRVLEKAVVDGDPAAMRLVFAYVDDQPIAKAVEAAPIPVPILGDVTMQEMATEDLAKIVQRAIG